MSLYVQNALSKQGSRPRKYCYQYIQSNNNLVLKRSQGVQKSFARRSHANDGVIEMLSEKFKGIADEAVSSGNKIGNALKPYDPINVSQKALLKAKEDAQKLKNRWDTLSDEDKSIAKSLIALTILTQFAITAAVEIIDDLPHIEEVAAIASGATVVLFAISACGTAERRTKAKAYLSNVYNKYFGSVEECTKNSDK